MKQKFYEFSRELQMETFQNVGRVMDWRNYISPAVKKAWENLPVETKVVLYMNAQAEADKEEWD